MQAGHFIGIAIALAAFIIVELESSAKVKSAEDFDKGGGKGGVFLVCGTLLGTIIAGQSTIGTAQFAFTYGLAGIWYTLGSALGCLMFYFGYIIPLRISHDSTLTEVIGDEFGPRASCLGSVLCTFGMLISVISNMIAASALVTALTGWKLWEGCLLAMVLMFAYVALGGVIGAGMGGVVKTILLYLLTISCIFVTIRLTGEIGPDTKLDVDIHDLFARGVAKELFNGLALVLGIISTQSYAQAFWLAKNYHVARKGALIGALLCLPVGFGSVLVGIFMKNHNLENAAEAFPTFLLHYMNPLIGGLGLGALIITVVTGAGGLVLGASTILVRDILGRRNKKYLEGKRHLLAMRTMIVAILLCAAVIAVSLPGTLMNDLGFLSMGLRGTVIFVPLSLALFFKGRFDSKWVCASMIAGPILLIVGNIANIGPPPLIWGVAASLIICMMGYRKPQEVPSK